MVLVDTYIYIYIQSDLDKNGISNTHNEGELPDFSRIMQSGITRKGIRMRLV